MRQYYSLATAVPASETPTAEQLAQSWEPIVISLARLAKKFNKTIAFDEVGYCSGPGNHLGPAGTGCHGPKVSLPEQTALVEALMANVYPQSWFAGLFYWAWTTAPKSGDAYGFTVDKKPAGAVFKKAFSSAVPPAPKPPPGPACSDTPPSKAYTCAQQSRFGKCDAKKFPWMVGFCCKTCFNCTAACGHADAVPNHHLHSALTTGKTDTRVKTDDVAAAAPSLLFVAKADNDILVAARSGSGSTAKVFGTIDAALAVAATGDGLLVMAERMLPSNPGVPQNGTGVSVSPAQWTTMKAKELSVFIEFPAHLPGASTPLPVAQTLFERVVVSPNASGLVAPLGALDLLHPHKHVDFAVLPASLLPHAQLVLAKVAGFDTACFGLPAANATHPFLVEASPSLLIAATQLSYCRRRRFAPSDRWMAVISRVLSFASGGAWQPPAAPLWVPSVTTSFNSTEPLPSDAERQAVIRGVSNFRSCFSDRS